MIVSLKQPPWSVFAAAGVQRVNDKPGQGATTGLYKYNKSEGGGNAKRWDAYKEEVGEPGKQMASPAYKFWLCIG